MNLPNNLFAWNHKCITYFTWRAVQGVGGVLNSLQLWWSSWVLLLLPVIFKRCLLGVGANKSLQKCKWVNVSTHVGRDGACRERGLAFSFWCKLQPSGKGRWHQPGWFLTSQRDDRRLWVWNVPSIEIPAITASPYTLHEIFLKWPFEWLCWWFFYYKTSFIIFWFNTGCCLYKLKIYCVYCI